MCALRAARGETPAGYKVGCTSPAVRDQLGLTEPIFAPIFSSRFHPDGVTLSAADFASCAVEPELVLTIGEDLEGTGLPTERLRGAIQEVRVGIELHHFHFWAGAVSAQELVCSGGMHAGLVVGARAMLPDGLGLNNERMSVRVDGVEAEAAPASEIMGGPLRSLAWLLDALCRHGCGLAAGSVVIPGAPVALVRIDGPGQVEVEVRGVGVATARFVS